MSKFLIYEQRGHIVFLTMNEPERRNPLTGNTAIAEFLMAFERIRADLTVRAVVLTGAGVAFCAGGDIRGMRQAIDEVRPIDARQAYVDGIQRLAQGLFDLAVPVIAAVNGAAVGAGLDLACMCDVRIASDRAKFSASFVKLGLIPGDGGAWLLPRVVGMSRAAELSFTGDVIDAAQALAWGLVSSVVGAGELLDTATALAERIAANPPHAVRLTKQLMREALSMRFDTSLQMAASLQPMLQQMPDHQEAVDAFLEKRPAAFRG